MEYQITKDQQIVLLLAEKISNQEQYHQAITLNENIIHAALRTTYVVSLKAILLAVFRIVKNRQIAKYTSPQFQRDLTYLLMSEENQLNPFKIQDINQPSIHIFLKGYDDKFCENIFVRDQMNNLDANIPEIIKYYKLNKEELLVEGDCRGSIYNSISMKKFKK